MKKQTMHRLFVYGTLKSGHGNNRYFLSSGRMLGNAITCDKFLLMGFGGCPGMYDAKRAPEDMKEHVQQIKGELWECDEQTRNRIDGLEGHPHAWRRMACKVSPILGGDGNPLRTSITVDFDCETYIYQGAVHGQPCEDGIWPRPIRVAIA